MRLRSWLLFGLILLAPAVSAAAEAEPKRVLIVHSFGSSAPPFTTLSTAFETALTRAMGKPVDLDQVSLDMARYAQPDMEEPFAEFLLKRLMKWRPDLVVSIGSPAGRFVAKFRDRLFPGTPAIYTAEARTLPPDEFQKNATFVGQNLDLAGLVENILQIAPDTTNIVVVLGATPLERYWTIQLRQAFERFTKRVSFTWLNDLSFDQTLELVSKLPPRSFILLGLLLRDAAGVTHNEDEALQRLHAVANAPINGLFQNQLGLGIVGGRLYQLELIGEEAARIAVRILRGEGASSFPPLIIGALEPRYDWRELRRWKISEANLPPGSVVLYREPGLWGLYRWQIIGAISFFALQTGLIVALLAQRADRRRADLRFWQVVAAAPYGVVMVGQDGRIAMTNAQTEKLFGYRKEEIVGQPVEMLVPERFRTRHTAHRERFSAAPEVRPMGAGQELFGRRKDGSEFPVEIALSPAQPSAGRLVLATIVDISLRKQAEEGLRQSQIELRSLTGRLLQAQEGESRRIARELHDDLGQRLALLTVEMDLLRQKPPEAADQLGVRMQELLAQVRHLSSSVHDLSRQLHPSNLEQLGLVAALGGLCHELTHSHGLKIEFTHSQIPPVIAPDTAVCLYRIAQEGLRNVIKHSGSQRASVELSGTAEAISLRIVDDGIGFDPRLIHGKGGLGLVSMRERVLHLGGEIAIDSQPSGGTRLRVRLPLMEAAKTPTGS
jgi:PAS domain S-box-containing protein